MAAARLDGARRLYEALKAQGGREEPEDPALERPARTLEETAAQLGTAQAELERAERQLNMALGRQKAVGDPAALAASLLDGLEGSWQGISPRRRKEARGGTRQMLALYLSPLLVDLEDQPAGRRLA